MSGFRCVAAHPSSEHPTISARHAATDDTVLVQLTATDTGETLVRIIAPNPNNIRIKLNEEPIR